MCPTSLGQLHGLQHPGMAAVLKHHCTPLLAVDQTFHASHILSAIQSPRLPRALEPETLVGRSLQTLPASLSGLGKARSSTTSQSHIMIAHLELKAINGCLLPMQGRERAALEQEFGQALEHSMLAGPSGKGSTSCARFWLLAYRVPKGPSEMSGVKLAAFQCAQ